MPFVFGKKSNQEQATGQGIPNGRTEAAIKNAELQSCALSQAALYLQQQCSKKNRIFTKVEINLECSKRDRTSTKRMAKEGR
jgi:hypothetical protein